MKIAVCGNHSAVYCTESELVWTLEHLGHVVLQFQENRTSTEDMLWAAKTQGVELFIYIHTHGWKTPGNMGMDVLIQKLREHGVKTASFHLDRYWGLNKGDKREDRVGNHPFWRTDVVFTADGGNQTRFAAKGVKHRWLPPGIATRHCFRGVFQQEFACDVAFVGAKGYHQEYPFRPHLIEWLERMYGSRFKRFAGDAGGTVREARLNNLYASAKVVVGDSCFAGAPYYWSDRVPETLGRGGFLIHPTTEGLDIPGLVTFQAGNLHDLKTKIDYYLEHEDERRAMTDTAMSCVASFHTYDNRMIELLKVMETI